MIISVRQTKCILYNGTVLHSNHMHDKYVALVLSVSAVASLLLEMIVKFKSHAGVV